MSVHVALSMIHIRKCTFGSLSSNNIRALALMRLQILHRKCRPRTRKFNLLAHRASTTSLNSSREAANSEEGKKLHICLLRMCRARSCREAVKKGSNGRTQPS
jgi:hypothetical protein